MTRTLGKAFRIWLEREIASRGEVPISSAELTSLKGWEDKDNPERSLGSWFEEIWLEDVMIDTTPVKVELVPTYQRSVKYLALLAGTKRVVKVVVEDQVVVRPFARRPARVPRPRP